MAKSKNKNRRTKGAQPGPAKSTQSQKPTQAQKTQTAKTGQKSKPRQSQPTQSSRKPNWGNRIGAARGDRRINLILAAIVILALLAGGAYWYFGNQAEARFQELAVEGESALDQVRTLPDRGRRHLEPNAPYAYRDRFPTSGPHDPAPTAPGVYAQPQPDTKLVHALEHGNIVIYRDAPGDEADALLESWAGLYSGDWSGVVVVPESGLGEELVLSAWTKQLRLSTFDEATAAAFIDAYRGRGPEHPVR